MKSPEIEVSISSAVWFFCGIAVASATDVERFAWAAGMTLLVATVTAIQFEANENATTPTGEQAP